MRYHINVSSRQVVQRSTILNNNPNSFTLNAMQIIKYISLTGAPSPQHITSSMASSYNGVPEINTRHIEAVSM